MKNSVTSVLDERYGLAARPGQKIECPFCHHTTFSIKRDNTIGKCFHPTCGRFVTPAGPESGLGSFLHRVLEAIFQDMHAELIALKAQPHRNAYTYCVEERGLHPQVIADSMLGVIPSGYNVAEQFAPCLLEAEEFVEREKETKKPKKRSSGNSESTAAEKALQFLTEARDKLEDCIRHRNGWLSFFYTDAAHRFVAIRFRQPYSKEIVYFKPGRTGGVFNHGLFTPYESPQLHAFNELLLVTEGEFNQLQAQSLCARMAEKQGQPAESGYIFACAVGGVHNVDAETIKRLGKRPIVCYDNDASGAGFTLVESLRQKTGVYAFTTPKEDPDLDDFLRGFGPDIDQAHASLKTLIQGRQFYTRFFEAVRIEIDEIRRREGGGKEGLKTFEVHRFVAEAVVDDLKERGRFYYDGRSAYFYLESDKKLLRVARDNQELELLLHRFGIAPSDRPATAVIDALRLEAFENGEKNTVYSFSHYDLDTGTLYVFNFGDTVYRITPDKIDLVDNGTDGVIFIHNPRWQPFKTVENLRNDSSPLDRIILSSMRFEENELNEGDMRLLFLVWFYSLFFPELFPTRPILAVIGERGSGKTFVLRKIGQLLYGPSFNVMQLSDDAKDFDAAVTNDAFVAVDNSDRYIKWLDDRLAVVATGGTLKKRELYTTNRLVEFPVTAFLGITSRTPHFRREDVSERLLLLSLRRLEIFVSESRLLAEIQENRDLIMTEVLEHLQEIVAALSHQAERHYDTSFRMADFADFALRLAHAQGWEARMHSILDRLGRTQTAFTVDGEPIIELLEYWLLENGEKNTGREVSSAELCKELGNIGKRRGIEFPDKGRPRAFAQHLSNLKGTLNTFFDVRERTGGGRKRFYSFRHKKDGERETEC